MQMIDEWGTGVFALTRRQREVAMLVAHGASNREIAQALRLSERSVETYVSAILARLDLRSRTQLAVWAVRRELAPWPLAEAGFARA